MLIVIFAQLLLLFLLSRFLTRELSFLFHRISRSRLITSYCIAIIFLPGTLVHELSHAIMAKLLFVHVGRIELMPEIQEESLKLGSVEVGKTDFIRNFFIGVAPFIVGTSLILFIMFYSFTNKIIGLNVLSGILLYILFVISNTMYSSKKDLEGAIEFFIFILLLVAFLFFLGVRISSLGFLNGEISALLIRQGIYFLMIPIGIDIFTILFAKLLNKKWN